MVQSFFAYRGMLVRLVHVASLADPSAFLLNDRNWVLYMTILVRARLFRSNTTDTRRRPFRQRNRRHCTSFIDKNLDLR